MRAPDRPGQLRIGARGISLSSCEPWSPRAVSAAVVVTTLIFIAVAGLGGPAIFMALFALAVGGYVMITWPFAGVLLLLATIPLENAFVLFEAGVTVTRLLGIGVAMGWLAGKVLRRTSASWLLSSPFAWAAAFFVAFVLASALWAEDVGVAQVGFLQLAQLFVFSVIIIDVTGRWVRLDWIVRILVLSAATAAGLTVLQYVAGGVIRAGGDIAGVNGTAELLVTLMPLAFYLMLFDERAGWRVLGAGYFALAIAAVSVTFSRMSFLLTPVVLGVLVWEMFRVRRDRAWFVSVAGVAAIVAVTIVPLDKVIERASSIAPYLQQTIGSSTADELALSSRGYHLKVGMVIFQDHPLLGVGYNNFGRQFTNTYQHVVPGAPKLYLSFRSPHSSHVGMLAELGFIGALFWIILLVVAARSLWEARGACVRTRDLRRLMAVRVVAYAFLLQVVPYAFYGPNQKAKIFWVLLGLAVVMEGLALGSRELPANAARRSSRSIEPRYSIPTAGHATD